MGLNISTEDPTAPSNEEHFLHDLAIPLTTFELNLDLLQQQYQHNPCLQRLRVGFEQIDLMLKTYRSYTFAKKNKCMLSQIIKESLQLFTSTFRKYGIQIETSLKVELSISHHAALVRRVMINLLKNSIEALDLEQEVRKIGISTFRSNNGICLKVYNSGKGFPEEQINSLGRIRTSTKKSGSGLGLIYVNKVIVHDFKGRVELQNLRQGGVNVLIYLPL